MFKSIQKALSYLLGLDDIGPTSKDLEAVAEINDKLDELDNYIKNTLKVNDGRIRERSKVYTGSDQRAEV